MEPDQGHGARGPDGLCGLFCAFVEPTYQHVFPDPGLSGSTAASAIAHAAVGFPARAGDIFGHRQPTDLYSGPFLSAWRVVLFSRGVCFEVVAGFSGNALAGCSDRDHYQTPFEIAPDSTGNAIALAGGVGVLFCVHRCLYFE